MRITPRQYRYIYINVGLDVGEDVDMAVQRLVSHKTPLVVSNIC